ncbi:hypothetical protein [Sutcliffiella halmapala]|uniref:hypothetical protein n=1 Tax=Sutcliffiella halmapala TaxID=79882 RepID=UPI000995A390|nr:hypothetical protein [Sutcliffiella halmapala]
MQRLKDEGIEVVIYEPGLQEANFDGFVVIQDLAEFKKASDLIVSNRLDAELADVEEKVYMRDLFNRD